MLNTRDSMRERTNERTDERTNEQTDERMNKRTYTTTKHITTLLLRSRVKISDYFVIDCCKIID